MESHSPRIRFSKKLCCLVAGTCCTGSKCLSVVSRTAPDLAVATHILQVFQSHLQQFEARLIAKRVGTAKANRIQDVNRVFKDVRKPSPVPVQMLIAKSVAHVVDIVDEGSVIVDNSDNIQHASVLESRLGPLHVIHIEEGQVWFTSPHTLDIGDTLADINLKGQIHDLHDEFISEWMIRWDRHRHLDPSHWDEVLAITETLLDCPVMDLQPITLSRWKAAIQSKKPSSATGLDAMSRKDLLAMPDELHEQMIKILHKCRIYRPVASPVAPRSSPLVGKKTLELRLSMSIGRSR